MKVCLYSHAFPPSVGGIETVSELLAEHLHRNGVEVTVVTQTASNGKEASRPYRIFRKPHLREVGQLAAAHDLVHCNGMSVRGTLSAFRCGVPIVVTHQGYSAAVPRSVGEFQRMLVKEGARRVPHAVASAWAMHLADVNACISRFVFAYLRPPRGVVIYNPINRIFRPLPGVERTDRLAFVGRLVSDKGCDVLIRALAECGRRGRRFGVDIYGDGTDKKPLQALARECDVASQVHFCGVAKGEALVRAYNHSLAVIVPSLWEEPLGIVALEAMACGRAVIASAGGGLGEVVDGIGLTFPNGDFGALADRMMRLAENPALRQQSEQKGDLFARNFGADLIGDNYLDLYRATLEERKRNKGPRTARHRDNSRECAERLSERE